MGAARRRGSGWRAGAVAVACLVAGAGCGACGASPGGGRSGSPAATATAGAAAPPHRAHRSAREVAVGRSLSRDLRRGARAVGASGAEGAVVVRGRGLWAGAAGEARSPQAVFSIASLTKPFIATLVLRRVQERRLSLGDTAGSRLGGAVAPEVGSATLRDLLGHTSGLADYFADPAVQAAEADPRHRWTQSELLHAIRRAGPPGAFGYTNANYVLLGAVLRREGGRSVGAQLRDEVVRPLGLAHTSLDRDRALARRFVGGVRPPDDHWGELFSDGGIASTAPDVARFFDALLVGRRLLRPPTLRRMMTVGPSGSYGLGLGTARLGRCRLWGHAGFFSGWISAALTERRAGVTTVVLLHGGRKGDAKTLALRLLRRLDARGRIRC